MCWAPLWSHWDAHIPGWHPSFYQSRVGNACSGAATACGTVVMCVLGGMLSIETGMFFPLFS